MKYYVKLIRNLLLTSQSKIQLTCIMFSSLSYADHVQALSAQTFNQIRGTSPYLLLSDGVTKVITIDELLGFYMPKQDGSDGLEQIKIDMANNDTILNFPKGMKYSDVMTLVIADGEPHDLSNFTIGDDDGDAVNSDNTYIKGKIKATWYNGETPVSSSMLNQAISSCGGPYSLVIEIPEEVIISTAYGLPSDNLYGTHIPVTYRFMPKSQESCYFLQPLSMQIYSNGNVGTELKYANGYNEAKWEKGVLTAYGNGYLQSGGGFKANSGFPTTGFEKATFSIIAVDSDQSNYRCSSTDNNGKITLSGSASVSLGENCKITYNSVSRAKFVEGGTPTIHLEHKIGSDWISVGSYTIPVPAKWAVGKSNVPYADQADIFKATTFPILDTCRLIIDGTNQPNTTVSQATDFSEQGKKWRQKYLFRRNELSNVPYGDPINYPEDNNSSGLFFGGGNFSRDVDGTFMGEWGDLSIYSGSPWNSSNFYFTSEYVRGNQNMISNAGGVYGGAATLSFTAACRDNGSTLN